MLWDKIKNIAIAALAALSAILFALFKYKSHENKVLSEENAEKDAEIDIKDFEGEIKDMKAKTLEEADEPTDIKPGKLVLSLLPLFLFVGCTKTVYVHPKLELLPKVKEVEVQVDKNLCVCGKDLEAMVKGYKQLRRNEKFYRAEIIKLNERANHE